MGDTALCPGVSFGVKDGDSMLPGFRVPLAVPLNKLLLVVSFVDWGWTTGGGFGAGAVSNVPTEIDHLLLQQKVRGPS